ncbi:diatom-specific cyclin [Seminavis robusta]|uniref:Diatom-specific cyclin n=1 Tax=Seminavis robusta TaxID=568900 RepID=A0A9N8EBU3_9STRA|nr:diatom-specific cyclin [Seminavis robusta]|eukprot:Sro776_g200900.1 diatom-specific cyclin (390) ;mRNA; f:22013-23302
MATAPATSDQLQAMRWQEITSYKTFDYVQLSASANASLPLNSGDQTVASDASGLQVPVQPPCLPMISPQWRQVICEWAYKLVDHFDCPREVVGVAMNFVDRYLCNVSLRHDSQSLSKREFKLLCLACLFLAFKLEKPNLISLDALLTLSRDLFTRAQLVAMERSVLKELRWRLHPPTAFSFLEYYALQLRTPASSTTANADYCEEILDTARFLVELSVMDYHFVSQRPSHVAIGALLNALDDNPTIRLKVDTYAMSHLLSLVSPVEVPEILRCKTRLRAIHVQVTDPQPCLPTEQQHPQTFLPAQCPQPWLPSHHAPSEQPPQPWLPSNHAPSIIAQHPSQTANVPTEQHPQSPTSDDGPQPPPSSSVHHEIVSPVHVLFQYTLDSFYK